MFILDKYFFFFKNTYINSLNFLAPNYFSKLLGLLKNVHIECHLIWNQFS